MTEINLQNLSAKYLVDYLNKTGWSVGLDDFYISGELLAEVLPRFGDGEGEIKMPVAPRIFTLTTEGAVDWARLTKQEVKDYQDAIAKYNTEFGVWAKQPVKTISLTDKQLAVVQKMIKYFMPRSEEDRQKDKEKQQQREELPKNEFSFRLLKELKLSATS